MLRENLAIGFFILGLTGLWVGAHSVSSRRVDQRLEIQIGDRYVEIVLEVRCAEFGSRKQVRRMDRDGDGGISRRETLRYLRELNEAMLEDLQLWVDGDRLELRPWLEPAQDSSDTQLVSNRIRRVFHYVAWLDSGRPGLRQLRILNRCFERNRGSLQFIIGQAESVHLRKISLDEYTPFRLLLNRRELVAGSN